MQVMIPTIWLVLPEESINLLMREQLAQVSRIKNQDHPISGNFVVALKEQRWRTRRIIWAATVNATDPDEIKGVSYSEDAGDTWKTTCLESGRTTSR